MRTEHEILLRRLAEKGLDALTPAQVDALAAAAENDPFVAQRLGAAPAPDAAPWRSSAPQPTAADWERIWEGIEAAGRADTVAQGVPARWWRLAPLMSAAAAVLLALMWWNSPSRVDGVIQLSAHTEIQALETYDDGTVFITDAGDDSGAIVIWSVDSELGA